MARKFDAVARSEMSPFPVASRLSFVDGKCRMPIALSLHYSRASIESRRGEAAAVIPVVTQTGRHTRRGATSERASGHSLKQLIHIIIERRACRAATWPLARCALVIIRERFHADVFTSKRALRRPAERSDASVYANFPLVLLTTLPAAQSERGSQACA